MFVYGSCCHFRWVLYFSFWFVFYQFKLVSFQTTTAINSRILNQALVVLINVYVIFRWTHGQLYALSISGSGVSHDQRGRCSFSVIIPGVHGRQRSIRRIYFQGFTEFSIVKNMEELSTGLLFSWSKIKLFLWLYQSYIYFILHTRNICTFYVMVWFSLTQDGIRSIIALTVEGITGAWKGNFTYKHQIVWVYVGLNVGAYVCYPAFANDKNYDAMKRPW